MKRMMLLTLLLLVGCGEVKYTSNSINSRTLSGVDKESCQLVFAGKYQKGDFCKVSLE